MLFTLKKIVGGLLLPLPALLLLIGIGIALLWFSRFQRTGKLCVSLGWLLLALLSLQPVADSLLKPIEDSYPTWRGEQPVSYVVVLGGGYTWNPEWAPSSNLINNSLPRPDGGHSPVAGESRIENDLYRRGGKNQPRQHGGGRGESRGEPRRTTQRYHRARSAERYRRGSAGGEARHRRCALPAGHFGVPLPRAMIFFRHAGLDPLPAPANQLAVTSPLNPWERAIPSPVWLMHSDRVGYETLGRVWQWLKGGSGEPGQE
ncbi:membrane protein [Klebsiella variicola]|nr:membrane protein [Klebsiella variicola]